MYIVHIYVRIAEFLDKKVKALNQTVKWVTSTELKDDRMENYGAYIGFISKYHCHIAN